MTNRRWEHIEAFVSVVQFGSFTSAFGSEGCSNRGALTDHALVDALAHGLVVVDTLEADVEQFDAELFNLAFAALQNFLLKLASAFGDGWQDSDIAG